MGEKNNKKLNMVTITTFIFLPITFLTGLYGMNFAHMPELEGHFNYYFAGLDGVYCHCDGGIPKKKEVDLNHWKRAETGKGKV